MFAFHNVIPFIAVAAAAMFCASCTQKAEEEVLADVTGAQGGTPTTEVVEEVEVVPEQVRVGRIMGVGEEGRFVVIALDQGATVETGDTLKARFADSQTAVLKVSPERQGNLVTADVVLGTPAKDHEVVK